MEDPEVIAVDHLRFGSDAAGFGFIYTRGQHARVHALTARKVKFGMHQVAS
jgi:hypothetical protein